MQRLSTLTVANEFGLILLRHGGKETGFKKV